jgi:hypothetical protein
VHSTLIDLMVRIEPKFNNIALFYPGWRYTSERLADTVAALSPTAPQ